MTQNFNKNSKLPLNSQIEKQFLSSSINSHQFSKTSFFELSHSSFTKVSNFKIRKLVLLTLNKF
jgi:hypothetical protein